MNLLTGASLLALAKSIYYFTASVEVKNDNSEDFINLGEHDVSE